MRHRQPEHLLPDQGAEQGNSGKKDHKDDGEVKNQAFYAAPCFIHCTCTTAAEGAAQACSSRLEQDKDDYGYAKNNLYYSDCWKPLLSHTLSRFRLSPFASAG
jgi:hypothetical protein